MQVVVLYARVSRDDKELRVSVDRQLVRCRKYAADHYPGVAVAEFVDNDRSGGDPDVIREGYLDMLSLIRSQKPGSVKAVIVNEQSRLTRREDVWQELVVTLTKAGITHVHTLDKGPVSVEPGNRLIGSIMNLIDAEERARTQIRMLNGYEQLRAEGRPGGNTGGYGYRTTKGADMRKTLEVIPEQARFIRKVMGLVAEGVSLGQVARMINQGEMVASGREATHWSPATLRSMLTKPSLAGLRSRTVPVREGSKSTFEQIIGKAQWEPIITLAEREQVLAALNRREVLGSDGIVHRVVRRRGPQPRRWLLTNGLFVCAVCGNKLEVGNAANTRMNPKGERVRQYRCCTPRGCGRQGISHAEWVEEWVYGQLLEYLDTNPEVPAQLVAQPNPEIDRLYLEQAAAQADYNDAVDLKGAGDITMSEFRRMRARATERLERAEKALAELALVDDTVPDPDTIRDHWHDLTLVRQQRALAHYVDRIVLNPAVRPQIRYSYDQAGHRSRCHDRIENTYRR